MQKKIKQKSERHWGFDVSTIDTSVKPADDFYRYANGNWFKNNPMPPDESRWGSFMELRQKSIKALNTILDDASKTKNAPDGSELQKVRDFYLSGMNRIKLARDGSKPLIRFFDMIDKISTKDDFVSLVAYFHQIGIPALWRLEVDQDLKNNSIVALYLGQGGLGLPDRDYYIKTDKDSKRVRYAYSEYIKRLHKLVNGRSLNKKKVVDSIMKIETRLARVSMTRVERRDLEKQYNKMKLANLTLLAPSVDWRKYFELISSSDPGYLIIAQPLFIREVNKMMKDVPMEDWKVYLKWKVIDAYANYLSDDLVQESFNFHGKVLSGVKKMKPRWRRCAEEIDSAIGEALGKLYVEKHFGEDAKKHIKELVNNLIAAYKERIKSLDWMGEATKKKALGKLKAFSSKLGYPDRWLSYKKLRISPDSYLENHISAYRFDFLREMNKVGKKPDRKEWHITPPTVNAYHNFLMTEIVFPAGIMQQPFFDPAADDAVNYGAIGAIIGHELTHGFDDKGSKFNKNGEMKNWWSKKDRKLFENKTQVLVDQFNKYEVLPGVFVNGMLTLGENIADLGGLVIAYYAYRKSLKGQTRKVICRFTPEQRFFLGAAQAERGYAREEEIKRLINMDPHSPNKARVNIPLSNMTEFYEAFGVKKGDKMHVKPAKRVEIW